MEHVLTIIFLLIGIAVGIVALVKALPRRLFRRRIPEWKIDLVEVHDDIRELRINTEVQLKGLRKQIKKLKREKPLPTPPKKNNDEKPPFIPVPHNSPERL